MGSGVIVSLLHTAFVPLVRVIPLGNVLRRSAKKGISLHRELSILEVQLSLLSKSVHGFINIIDGNCRLTSTGLLLIVYLRFCCFPEFRLKICSHRKIMFMFKSEKANLTYLEAKVMVLKSEFYPLLENLFHCSTPWFRIIPKPCFHTILKCLTGVICKFS